MSVLVTGASGLVGSAVCSWLLDKGMLVTGTANNSDFKPEHKNFTSLKIDLAKEKISGNTDFNYVIHCSAVIPKPGSQKSNEVLFDLNQEIDRSVFSYCLEKKSKLVYISTAYIYDDLPGEVLTEESPIKTNLEGYYKSKRRSEEFITSSELDYTIFRLSSPYGNLQLQHNVMRLFSEKIENNLPVSFIGNGERRQNFIHTDDIAEACCLAMYSSQRETYNLSYDKSYTMLELATYLKEIYNSGSEFIFDATKQPEINVNFDNSRLKKELNWAPKWDLKSGLIKTLLH